MILIGEGRRGYVATPLKYANRHVMVAGASGTGKTTTAGALCESLVAAGVPTLVVDAKGDLEGLIRRDNGVVWCPYGTRGTRRGLDLWEFGPEMLARALGLSPIQAGVMEVLFAVAEEMELTPSSIGELKALLSHGARHAKAISVEVGLISPSSIGAVQRALLRLERTNAGAFGQPALDPLEAMQMTASGEGRLTVYSAPGLTSTTGLYGACCAFLLNRLYERLPEQGDAKKPVLAVFVDEAHLIFDGAAPELVKRIEQVMRLIRSKGVCVLYATQSPADLPDAISGQLATRVQHGLRASTPRMARGVKAAAELMPVERGFDAYDAILRLGVGEALVSVPDQKGRPTEADVVKVSPGSTKLSPLLEAELVLDVPHQGKKKVSWWRRLLGG